ATLVVVGDVKPETVLALAKTHFGPIKKSPPINRVMQKEPPSIGKKTVLVQTQAEVPMLMQGYIVPSVASANEKERKDPYALEIIAGLLDAGEGARLHKNLIRGNQSASNVGTDYNLYTRYETQFIIYGSPSQSNTLESLAPKMTAELKRLQQERVLDEELNRVKTQLIAEKTFERDSIFSQAMELGLLETIGLSFDIATRYEQRIQEITAEDIQRVARRYFTDSNLTEAHLIPHKAQRQLEAKP
ncbi:MAG: M16 family metallopeptidase, partial [Legionellaceae bacterium]